MKTEMKTTLYKNALMQALVILVSIKVNDISTMFRSFCSLFRGRK